MEGDADILARLDALEAREAILALKARYWRAVDAGKADIVEDCLIPEVRIDFEGIPPCSDRESFMATVRAAAGLPGHFHMHHGKNPEISVTGPDSARGRWAIHYRGIIAEHGMMIQMAGHYDDEYVRRDGRWKISAMRMRQGSFESQLASPSGAVSVSSLPGEAGNFDNQMEQQ